jgi:hypothetical protein
MRQTVAKRIKKELKSGGNIVTPNEYRSAKREYNRKRSRQNPKPKISKRQERLALQNK